jgi:hypothetical protein
MKPITKRSLIAAGGVAAVIGFLLFRPDTLVTNVRVDEPLAAGFTSTTVTTEETSDTTTVVSSTTTDAATTTSVASTPVALTAGTFSGIDHAASGSVTVYEQDGQRVLRFEDNTDIQNGPDLYVWLLAADTYEGGTPSAYIDLGTLKGNLGAQNYLLPAEFDPEIHRAVLIWCLRFAVPFATAPLG